MKIKTGDKVIVIAGKNKGSTGKVSKVLRREEKVIVEGLNMVKKHLKPDANSQSGSIIELEAPLHISNVMLVDPKSNKRMRAKKVTAKKQVKSKDSKKVIEKSE